MQPPYQVYRDLLQAFVIGELSAAQFSTTFFKHYRIDNHSYGPQIGGLLNELMAMTDAYCEDPTLRGPLDIDEKQFLLEAQELLSRFQKL